MASIQRYVASEPRDRLNDDLTRSAVERQLSIVQEALRVALLQDPGLRQRWPDLDAVMRRCARLRDWEDPVSVEELAGFVDVEMQNWQGRIASLLKQQQEEGTRLDQQIGENLRRLDF
ncbi:MAG: hypothetical protein ACK55X_01855 [Synechococcaceae cyanobacterium]